MLVVTIALAGVAVVGALTVVSVHGSMRGASNSRFQDVALRAAESGVAAGQVFLRSRYTEDMAFSGFVEPNNTDPQSPADLPGNGVLPGQVGNLFDSDITAWYEVTILNNPTDPGFADGDDDDRRVVLRSVGHGPDGATVIVEAEVSGLGLTPLARCGSYGQRGQDASGAGRNDCLGDVDQSNTATYRPGN